ncbi:hypothetical protein BYT27DRAFT_6867579 [Phlegmacium glaucopus]|nr:hypothetical protein BYT27DRAFT_6867579 [Phlegmacium glaucopus]
MLVGPATSAPHLFPLPGLHYNPPDHLCGKVRHHCCSLSRLQDDSLTSKDETLHRHGYLGQT